LTRKRSVRVLNTTNNLGLITIEPTKEGKIQTSIYIYINVLMTHVVYGTVTLTSLLRWMILRFNLKGKTSRTFTRGIE